MGSLEKHIEGLSHRFIAMRKENSQINGVNETITRIEVDFSPNLSNFKWQIFGLPNDVSTNQQEIKCVKRKSNDDVYYLFSTSPNIDFIRLIQHAQMIVNVNTAIEERRSLLELKIQELTKLFSELDYKELNTLTFKYKQKKKKEIKESEKAITSETIYPENKEENV